MPATTVPRDAAPRRPATGSRPRPDQRLMSIDILRGGVMVLMALDHVREFLHIEATAYDPTDLTNTTPLLFFTRWITHFCAPVFVFLAGSAVYLSLSKTGNRAQTASFLRRRGLWLIVAELTIIRFGWFFNMDYGLSIGQVIWAIGWAMIALSFMVGWRPVVVAAVGGAIVALHNLLDGMPASAFGSLDWVWAILYTSEGLEPIPGFEFIPRYPLLPWIGVMALGFGFARLFGVPPNRRKRTFLALGAASIAAFVVLRAPNLYGDTRPWTADAGWEIGLLSFINTDKYPPSLLFLLMTLGPSVAFLAVGDKVPDRIARPFVVFGRVPFFYYVLHIPVIHATAILLEVPLAAELLSSGGDAHYGLGTVYLIWAAVVIGLYPLCRWYAGVKRRSRSPLLRYF